MRATPSVAPDGRTLLVVSVGGGVTKHRRFRRHRAVGVQVGDRLRIRIHAALLVTDRCVIVGEVDHLAASTWLMERRDGSARTSNRLRR
ncbi:MAG: hypothetical protein R2789_14950 [Microthrixaceae bacterium]